MSFQSLYKVFVSSDSETFINIYQNRFNSEATLKFDLYIKENQFFFFFHNEIQNQITQLEVLSNKVKEIFKSFPTIAMKQCTKKL